MSQESAVSSASAVSGGFISLTPMAVGEWNENTALFFWENGTQSEFNFKDDAFYVNKYGFDTQGIRDNAPVTVKSIVAIIKDPRDKTKRYAFWGDGTWCDWSGSRPTNMDFKDPVKEGWKNWPGGKVLVTALSWGAIKTYFFWNDGTYGEYNWESAQFDQTSLPQSTWAQDWPANKKLIGALSNPQDSNPAYFFWNDGTYCNYWRGSKSLEGTYKPVSYWAGWPVAGMAFDAALHEIEDVLINYNLDNEHFVILSDGKTQVAVHVWVKVRDKENGQSVKIVDRGTRNQNLITFYDYQLGPENSRGSYIPYVGTLPDSNSSQKWKVGRSRNPTAVSTDTAEWADERRVADSMSDSPAKVAGLVDHFDGWNRFTYYVTTTESGVVKQLAARVGVAGSYRYTGSDWSVEYAEIEAVRV